ncbi:hypothetical protein EVAR_80046_1 [Eumeta japonica]|uniref:Integrase zinc-binding domain-containing protein n=1 Tax=Eumeta variegata TaxID=151549 RepID=A0A4C1WL15_EUMVA|nr:hypothetical protein EVAR_80046_1 [Eumeta japonica]
MEQTYTQHSMRLTIHQIMQKNEKRIGRADGKTSADIKRRSITITRLYIKHTHRQLHHAGAEATINECRQRYYITRIRTVTRDIIRRCIPCRIKSVPASPPTGTTSRTGWHITDAVHLHGDRLLRAANSENRSNYE